MKKFFFILFVSNFPFFIFTPCLRVPTFSVKCSTLFSCLIDTLQSCIKKTVKHEDEKFCDYFRETLHLRYFTGF